MEKHRKTTYELEYFAYVCTKLMRFFRDCFDKYEEFFGTEDK